MKKSSNLKRIVAMGLAVVMTLGMAGCNNAKSPEGGTSQKGEPVAADPSLAKQYVYRYADISLSGENEDLNISSARKDGDRLEILTMRYDYSDDGTESQILTLYNMKNDGSDITSLQLEAVKDETAAEGETKETVGEDDEENVDGENVDDYSYSYSYFQSSVLTKENVLALRTHYNNQYVNGEYVNENTTNIIGWNKSDGTLAFNIPFDMEKYQNDDSYSYVNRMIGLSNDQVGLLMSGDQAGIITVGMDGTMSDLKKIASDKDIFSMDPAFAERPDGSLYVAYYSEDWTKQYIRTFHPADGSLGQEYEVPAIARNNGFFNFCSGNEKDILYSNSEGVFGFNLGDTEVTKVMDYVNSDLVTYSLSNLISLDATHFAACYYDNTTYKTNMAIFSYVKPEDIQDKKVLVYAGIYIDTNTKANIIRFNKKSTEYRITIEDYSKYNTEEDYTLATTKLNNDMIAGKVPDILHINTSMAVNTFVEKGLLANIDEMIKGDAELSQQEYMDNVFEAYRVNGALYQVVPHYYIRTWIGKKSLVGDRNHWTMEDVKQAATKLVGDKSIFGLGMTRDTFISMMMNYCGSDFIDKNEGKCNFNNQNFISMLEYARTLPESEETGGDEDYWQHYWESYQTMYRENRALLMECTVGDPYSIKYSVNGQIGEDVSYIGFPTETGSGSYVESSITYAISAKSANKDGAWQFVRFFLTEEYQKNEDYKYGYSDGMSILKKLVREQVDKTMEKPYWTDENGQKVEYDDTYWINDEEIIIQPFTKEQADNLFNFLSSVKNTSYSDENISKIVDEEIASFFAGSKSAADVANMIQNRVQLYLNENK